MRIAIIGAGMAGLSCAQGLRAQGHDVVLFDKGRGAGGRMATRRLATSAGEATFDHGVQYLTARDPAFAAQVERWARAGRVARWPAAGPEAWVGTPAMNAPVHATATGLDVRWGTKVDALVFDGAWRVHGDGIDAGPFEAVVVAVPAEQVVALVQAHAPGFAELAQATRSDPCWTVMAAFDARVAVEGDRLTDLGTIGSAVRNAAKPGRSGPEAWVLQASADWSRAHLEDEPPDVAAAVLRDFAGQVGLALPAVLAVSAHRWRYAKCGTLGQDALWADDLRLGICGDWLLGPRVEAAWLSGHRLAARMGGGRTGAGAPPVR